MDQRRRRPRPRTTIDQRQIGPVRMSPLAAASGDDFGYNATMLIYFDTLMNSNVQFCLVLLSDEAVSQLADRER